jgi:glutamate synthase (NADPH/NADH) small chain
MGNPKAFLEIHRQEAGYRPIHDRIHDFGEVEQTLNTRERKLQASRCMDCGVPFCHWACPLGNKAPEWNDALYKGEWEQAFRLLTSTNPFPEFTGRICPALCEKACVLNRFNHEPTTNREDECAIIEAAFREGYIQPRMPARRCGKRVAVVGAGPAGLAAADALNPAAPIIAFHGYPFDTGIEIYYLVRYMAHFMAACGDYILARHHYPRPV